MDINKTIGIDKIAAWNDTLGSIKVSVSSAIFSTWFSQTHLAEVVPTDGRFLAEIGCNSSFVKNTIETRYFGLIQDTLVKILGKPCDLTFVIKNLPSQKTGGEKTLAPLFETGEERLNEEFTNVLFKARIRPGHTFENFAVSSSNQMAHAAAEAVAQSPGKAYNPLFIWGGVGVGKTHLMVSIAHEVLKKNSETKVYFCTGEDFTNDIVEGIRNKTTQAFRNKYRKLNILLVDDIQFIAGKDSVQEEFFHTFNAVTSAGGQIILTSDKPPSEISKFEERLKSRFEAGLIVDIAPPDFELRCAITQIKSKEKGLTLEMDQVQLIASNLESARKIEGLLVNLLTQVKIKKVPLTNELIETSLGKGVEINGKSVKKTPEEIFETIAKYYQIGKRVLLGRSRSRPIARPRQILMYLLRTELQMPFEEVGRLTGGRDHSTVMHAVNKITALASTNVQIREDILSIKNKL
ncbi:chromosomal replication initiator protein DnaA [Candidatus Woesebacteria bacterium CG22_combo_CG10-13_8_21_14_all_39_10]|uniref:Chromosomal replication initiator protein DnaA n=4 Tax=Candidatus Woeseibacteriota TaxID=1752722 RepID=A0A2M7X988_9BACT|nr:MAG: chromosomal replication initiator protein DnaA [Candidatus Woesebacteria bacterium CG22_combo_CG10-13_8_21_14_all_39_10]PIU71866.1 MAG: chromosomal replication initiator protein DnaA [Candidatus Woesebacteria bacterium CG06_land_8_20_14_3_00_39_27]PJA42714.1 MAG: chromosomal replication initiator protein DnaA [Candidatus Woesebacteria bacterium CG_4_9_14_3_um_filter_39_10]